MHLSRLLSALGLLLLAGCGDRGTAGPPATPPDGSSTVTTASQTLCQLPGPGVWRHHPPSALAPAILQAVPKRLPAVTPGTPEAEVGPRLGLPNDLYPTYERIYHRVYARLVLGLGYEVVWQEARIGGQVTGPVFLEGSAWPR